MSALLDKVFRGHPAHPAAASAQSGGYRSHNDAASVTDARMASWLPVPASADADLLPELDLIRSRSRDLNRNSPLAGSHAQTLKDNVIGHQLRLSSKPDYRLLGRDADWARDWGTRMEAEFRTWANTTECDASRTQTLWGMARTAFGGFIGNGDHITLPLWLPQPGTRWSTRLRGIESDRLSTPAAMASSPYLRGGVELDENGATLAYHIRKSHPGDWYGVIPIQMLAWDRIPAFTPWGRRRVVHVFDKEREEQHRGLTPLSRVMRESRVLTEYVGHENHAAFANSLVAAFIESDLPANEVADLFGNGKDEAEGYWQAVSAKYNKKKLEGGIFQYLPIGTKLSSYNPNRPNVAFEPFVRFMIRYLSTGLNIPYELLLKDFSQTNYSSARAALLEAWRYFLACRQIFVDMWLQPILQLWMEEAVDKGRIEAPDFYGNEYAYSRCRWIFAGRGWVDPVKEAQAAQIRMEIGLTTLEWESAEQGQYWEETLDQQAIEMAYRKEKGLPDPNGTAGRGFTAPTDQPQGQAA